MNKRFAMLATMLVLAVPTLASASTLTTNQINAVISLLQSFGVDQATIDKVSADLEGAVPVTSNCVDTRHNLTLGSRGAEVTNLQNYLLGQGYLIGTSATGYYGYMTVQAVGKLQIAKSIVSSESDPAYGITGPKTRRAIACSTVPPPGQKIDFSAAPVSGAAPLDVAFTGTGTGVTSGSQYIIEYGDGANSGSLAAAACISGGTYQYNSVSCNVSATHTYTAPGTFTATLEPYVACMWSNPRCMIATQSLGQVTISVVQATEPLPPPLPPPTEPASTATTSTGTY